MKKLVLSFIFFCSVNVVAEQNFKDTKCSGPILTLAAISEPKPTGNERKSMVNQGKSRTHMQSQMSNKVEKFIKSNLHKEKNSIVFNESLIVKKKGKNKLLISLSKKGKASLLSDFKGKPPRNLGVKGSATCDCSGTSDTNDGCVIRTRGKKMWCESEGECSCSLETTIKSGIKAIDKV